MGLSAAVDKPFANWIEAFRGRAERQGVRRSVLDAAFRSVTYDPEVIRRDQNQAEFTKTIWEYLDSAVSPTRIKNGLAALARHARVLQAIESRYRVDKEVVVAIWGLESAYGEYRGDKNIIRSLATLAYDGRRGAFFEEQLIAALQILQSGDTTARQIRGSWAGAMGHTQFIPTSFLAYAVDFNGDGTRDIWSDDPTDSLASTAAYLSRFGWRQNQPWGIEVQLPADFDYRSAQRRESKPIRRWAQLGVRDMAGRRVDGAGTGALLLPAGRKGAKFLIFHNFSAIEKYNAADAYVLAVGHLSDRLKGKPPIQAAWPRGDRALSVDERKELQRRLVRKGYNVGKVDGMIGSRTKAAVTAFQEASGVPPDGYVSLELLERLR